MADPVLTGLVLYPDSLHIASLPVGRKKTAVETVVLSGEPERTLKDAAESGRLVGELHVALPAEDVMITVMDLPTRDAEEIEGMVSLRVEELSPFPVERTCAAWELVGELPGGTRVLVAIASLAAIQELHDRLAIHKCLIHRVDVDVLAWLHLLKDIQEIPTSGVNLLLIAHRLQTHLVLLRDDDPLLFRSMGNTRTLSEETLVEELGVALASANADWAVTRIDGIWVYHDGEPPNWAGQSLAGVQCETRTLERLPAVAEGVARRGLSAKCLDLAPRGWKNEEARRRQRRALIRGVGGVAAVWILLICGLVIAVQIRAVTVRGLREQLRAQEKPVAEIETLAERVRSLSQFTDRSHSALEALRLLAEALPTDGGVRISDFHYRKDQGMTFAGDAPSNSGAFFSFLDNLSAGGKIRVEKYDVKEQRGRTEFQATAVWNWPTANDGGEATP